jgi:hypothetical protein
MQEEKTFILEEQSVRNKLVPKNHSGEEKGKKSGAGRYRKRKMW